MVSGCWGDALLVEPSDESHVRARGFFLRFFVLFTLTLPALFFDDLRHSSDVDGLVVLKRGRTCVVIHVDRSGIETIKAAAKSLIHASLTRSVWAPILSSARRTLFLCDEALHADQMSTHG